MKSLAEIAALLRTDKGTEHNYLEFYDKLFGPLRRTPVCLLEIGIDTGDCLTMWEQYFPEGEIWGCDIEPKTGHDRFRQADSMDHAAVESAFGSMAFNVIIDDANHELRYQLGTYGNFRSHLAPGGIYVVEDVSGPMTALEHFRKMETKRSVTAIDLRYMKNRWDDALMLIEDKTLCTS